MRRRKIPKVLYKYRSFSDRTLDTLLADKIFFADPSTFNDPLDTRPSVEVDLEIYDLKSTLRTLIQQRVGAEMSVAAMAIKYKGPKTKDHIAASSCKKADQLIADIEYNATNPEYDLEDNGKFLFGREIERELLRRYDKGIFSLAERANCPLMWSHYADQHKGVCIGYSIPARAQEFLHRITYGGNRLIQASLVAAMLNGDKAAQNAVDEAVLSRKAKDWGYEKEWRLVGPRGLADSPLELEEVVFGMRCSGAVQYAIAKSLSDREHHSVKMYEIRESSNSFILHKSSLDLEEMINSYPRRSLDVYDFFDQIKTYEPEPLENPADVL